MTNYRYNPIISFYKYVQPTWYLNLLPGMSFPYWVDIRKLPPGDLILIDQDMTYQSESARLRDAAYQAWQKGVMLADSSFALSITDSAVSVKDQYHFIRKYFHSFWATFILLLRILSFKNPLKEIGAFVATLSVKRVNIALIHKKYEQYNDYIPRLFQDGPKVSIIIPTLSRYKYLRDVLADLEAQHYRNFEVIVVDQSDEFSPDFYHNWKLDLHVIRQRDKALWKARNTAIKKSTGEFILLFDDDSRIDADWISHHLKSLEFFNADISAGISISKVGSKVPPNYSYFRWSDQLDTGNVLLKKDIFRAIGLFDRQFEKMRMGDGEFGLRAYLSGYKIISNPHAKRIHLKAGSGGLRQMGSWDGFRPTNWFGPRPIPSVLYFVRKYFGNKIAILDMLVKVPPSIMPFKYKSKPSLLFFGFILSLIILPLVFFQVVRSWRISSTMLKQGPLIDQID